MERARGAVEELTQIAAKFGSKSLIASAAYAKGRLSLAKGDASVACRELELAVQLWTEVGAPYEGATTRMWLGEASRACGQEELAAQRFQAAAIVFRQLGATQEAARAQAETPTNLVSGRTDLHPSSPERRSTGVFRRKGDYWTITFQGGSTRIRDLRGMRYLARLLAQPGREFHVLDLVRSETGYGGAAKTIRDSEGLGMGLEASGLLDEQAKESYRRRLREIEEDIEDAEAMNNAERAAQARFERDFLVRELARAVGLGGRDRKAGAASERARVSVTRAVRSALARIRKQYPVLGEHLARAIRTGTYCAYLPDTRHTDAWQTD